AGSAGRAVAATLARRALKVRSSIATFTLSAGGVAADRPGRRGAVIAGLILLDERFHAVRVPFVVAVADNGVAPAAGLDEHIGEQHAGFDLHRRDVRHMYRLFTPSNPAGRVLHDAGRRDENLRRKQVIARTPAARAKNLAVRERTTFAPHPEPDDQQRRNRCSDRPIEPILLASHNP